MCVNKSVIKALQQDYDKNTTKGMMCNAVTCYDIHVLLKEVVLE